MSDTVALDELANTLNKDPSFVYVKEMEIKFFRNFIVHAAASSKEIMSNRFIDNSGYRSSEALLKYVCSVPKFLERYFL